MLKYYVMMSLQTLLKQKAFGSLVKQLAQIMKWLTSSSGQYFFFFFFVVILIIILVEIVEIDTYTTFSSIIPIVSGHSIFRVQEKNLLGHFQDGGHCHHFLIMIGTIFLFWIK